MRLGLLTILAAEGGGAVLVTRVAGAAGRVLEEKLPIARVLKQAVLVHLELQGQLCDVVDEEGEGGHQA